LIKKEIVTFAINLLEKLKLEGDGRESLKLKLKKAIKNITVKKQNEN